MKCYQQLLAMMCLLTLGACTKTQEDQKEQAIVPPNILFINAEDLSPRLGCYGDQLALTPVIDSLASTGIRYTNMFTVSGVCAPSRHSIIIGQYPIGTGGLHMRAMQHSSKMSAVDSASVEGRPLYEAVPSVETRCFPQLLRMAGYYTFNVSKEDYQFKAPLTVWDLSASNPDLSHIPKDKPFFAYYSPFVSHESQIWERRNRPSKYQIDSSLLALPPFYPDDPKIRADLAQHYRNIAALDSAVGRILSQFKQAGLLENTIVIFTTDHGDGLPRFKREVYHTGSHVPFIVSWPKNYKGTIGLRDKVDSNLHSFVDLAPTFLSLANVESPKYYVGNAFLGKYSKPSPTMVYAAKDRMDVVKDRVRAVYDGRYRYVRNFMPETPVLGNLAYRMQQHIMPTLLEYHKNGKLNATQRALLEPRMPFELYDLQNDPYEINNLAYSPDSTIQQVKERLAKALLTWMDENEDQGSIPETELVQQLWKGNEQPVSEAPSLQPLGGGYVLHSSTPGASIAYKMKQDEKAWRVYQGDTLLSKACCAVAHRIGFKASEEVEF